MRADKLFEISLTLDGPEPSAPWRLLSLDILVEHPTVQGASKDDSEARLVSVDHVDHLHKILTARLNTAGVRVR